MSRYRQADTPGGTYFFTVVTERRQRILTDEPLREALRGAIEKVRRTRPFRIDAWVLLPDHLHTLWALPQDDADFATRWRLIKSEVTLQCGAAYQRPDFMTERRKARGQGTLWQQRYWEHCIVDDADLRHHMDYVHWNPVKRGLVDQVRDWPWSSFHRCVAQGAYPLNWGVAPTTHVGRVNDPRGN